MAAILLMAPLLQGIPLSHDLHIHLAMADQFRASLAEGNVYPRWLADFNEGFGAPTMIFYPPGLFYCAGLASWLCGGNILVGFYLVLALLTIIGFAGVYRLLSEPAGPWAAAGVALTLVAPFRVFELHAAGLFPAYAAGCVFPWALDSLRRIASQPRSDGWLSRPVRGWAISVAAMLLLNLPFTVLALALVSVWLVFETGRSRRLDTLIRVTAGAAVAMSISAVYLMPALAERHLVTLPQAGQNVYAGNFIFMTPGAWEDPALQHLFQRMALFPLALAVVGMGLILVMNRGSSKSGQGVFNGLLQLVSMITVEAVFLASPASRWLWEGIPALATLQLPWRLLDHLAVSGSAITALALAVVWRSKNRFGWVRYAFAGFCLVLTLLMGMLSLSCIQMNGFAPPHLILKQIVAFRRLPADYPPRGSELTPQRADDALVTVARGQISGKVIAWESERRRIDIQAATSGAIALRTWYYSGWSARNEQGLTLPVTAESGTGKLLVAVPAGRHTLEIRFGATPLRLAAAWVSLLAALGFAIVCIHPLVAHYRKKQTPSRISASDQSELPPPHPSEYRDRMEPGAGVMKVWMLFQIVALILAGGLSLTWPPAGPPAEATAPLDVRKMGASELQIRHADGTTFTVRFMETVMAVIANPIYPLAAVFTTDEPPDSLLLVPPQPVATSSVYILHTVTGEFDRIPTDETMLGSWFFQVWSPDGRYAVILTSQWDGFKIFRAADWVHSSGHLWIDWRKPWRDMGAYDRPLRAGDPSRIHRFIGWEGPAVFSFSGSCCGTEFSYRYDIAQDRLTRTGQRELP